MPRGGGDRGLPCPNPCWGSRCAHPPSGPPRRGAVPHRAPLGWKPIAPPAPKAANAACTRACTHVQERASPLRPGSRRAQALLEARSPSRPFPCAGIYLTELLFKALTHLAQPQPAAPTPLRRCLLPAHPALCTPGALGIGEGMGESLGGLAPGLCPLLVPPCVLGELGSISVFASRAKLQS